MSNNHAVIIGAGAAGLMCAISAAESGVDVLVIDHANKAGKKILISGGGRCNFTNMYTEPSNYLSQNPHFCKSALKRYTQWDFIAEVDRVGLPWHEKKLGQLFSDNKSQAILDMLLNRCDELGVTIRLNCTMETVSQQENGFILNTNQGVIECHALVVASGAMSFPTMGATDFGHKLAKKFGLNITETRPGLVPFTLDARDLAPLKNLSGVAIDAMVSCRDMSFRENILFTHKGLSGPAILQISSYWKPGQSVTVCMLPDIDLAQFFKDAQQNQPNKQLNTVLRQHFPERLIEAFCQDFDLSKPLQQYKHKDLTSIAERFQNWQFIPSGTEGYKKAEVTLGGVDTDEVSSKTFEAKSVKGLYFIGEVLDVTGHLGGFNFQWAWASGHCCGKAIADSMTA
ncbi:NAD(P)/FAD-dependent oxidoreductase [Bermanella marisrubri]|uniref:Flavoprotein n=1 Tax=Bermanella marisrubri TaxID=207949 RepID=Q1N3Q1_9GAMM|nr:NAD(P)/FAD-dependent oxidoreductase [Bermanella marisrubri]EAT12823.1 hypothetical protein RED65_12159 [Oceanobacter sp. RED65] [Bermanella marisrubri]QIZ83145.1 NAD(P)/FAD-dependent oxidoreductase [Bermanella marisrubri]